MERTTDACLLQTLIVVISYSPSWRNKEVKCCELKLTKLFSFCFYWSLNEYSVWFVFSTYRQIWNIICSFHHPWTTLSLFYFIFFPFPFHSMPFPFLPYPTSFPLDFLSFSYPCSGFISSTITVHTFLFLSLFLNSLLLYLSLPLQMAFQPHPLTVIVFPEHDIDSI